jgi:hypothetical protein
MTPAARVIEMLKSGLICGLDSVQEAYGNYMRHYDMFFDINDQLKFQEVVKEFAGEVAKHWTLTVEEALVKVGLDPKALLDEFDSDLTEANLRAAKEIGSPQDYSTSLF